jgi:hypothetical protein
MRFFLAISALFFSSLSYAQRTGIGSATRLNDSVAHTLPITASFDDVLKNRSAICGLLKQTPIVNPQTQRCRVVLSCLATNLNNEPLYLIDGTISTAAKVQGMQPEDFESITVLKGGAAVALYGS